MSELILALRISPLVPIAQSGPLICGVPLSDPSTSSNTLVSELSEDSRARRARARASFAQKIQLR